MQLVARLGTNVNNSLNRLSSKENILKMKKRQLGNTAYWYRLLLRTPTRHTMSCDCTWGKELWSMSAAPSANKQAFCDRRMNVQPGGMGSNN
jgi:hypothetical protein